MHLIQNNPYRTIGLLVGATAAERRRQLTRLQRYIAAEQEPEDDFSFNSLGKLHRTLETVYEASSKLNLDSDKMKAALFWFYKGNPITDEPAFDALKEGRISETTQIWSKLVQGKEITNRNASAFSNWSNLYLNSAFHEDEINPENLEKGILLKLKFLESDFVKDLKALATDETFKTTKKELQLFFLNQVQGEIERREGISSNKLLEIVTKQVFFAKEEFLKGFVQKPIEQIEKNIKETRKNQKSNPTKAGEFGNELYKRTKTLLVTIISVLGNTDIKTVSISDKLANEILQCGITLFNHFHDTETEVGEIALDLNKKAKSIALGSVAKERINESTPIFERYIQNRPTREKQRIISDELKFITDKLENFEEADDQISNALHFIKVCKPVLDTMKLKIGADDELYSTISAAVVSKAQGLIVSTVNESMEKRNNYIKYLNYKNDIFRKMASPSSEIMVNINGTVSRFNMDMPPAPEYSLKKLIKVISKAWKATLSLEGIEMSGKQREQYNKNKNTLKQLYKKIDRNIVFFHNDTPIRKWMFWVTGIIGFLVLVASIWGEVGLKIVLGAAAVVGFFALVGKSQNFNR